MSNNVSLTSERSSYQAAFALDVLTAGIAAGLLALAAGPTFKRIKGRRFSISSKDRPTPLKTSLGTYLYLFPALLFIFTTYTLSFVSDLLKTTGTIEYDNGLALHGNRPFDNSNYDHSIAILSLVSAFLSILFTVLINGGVWIYSNHTFANGTGRAAPSLKSKIYNTLIMLAILGTGLAAWGYAVSVRSRNATWPSTVENDNTTRIIFIVYRCVIIAASISVSIEAARKYYRTKAESSRDVRDTNMTALTSSQANTFQSPERPNLARFALVVVPLIWIRNAFIIYDIVLLYVDSAAWSDATVLASQFLLIIFGQITNLTILGMILWGAWRTGRTVPLFRKMP